MILVIIASILIISYFGISLKGLVESDTTQDNFSYVASGLVKVWNNYLRAPTTYLWNNVFIDILWESFKGAMENIKNGRPASFEPREVGPTIGGLFDGFVETIGQ